MKPVIDFMAGQYVEEKETQDVTNKILGQGSTFLVAYGVHKLFAPVRLSLTLLCVPVSSEFFIGIQKKYFEI